MHRAQQHGTQKQVNPFYPFGAGYLAFFVLYCLMLGSCGPSKPVVPVKPTEKKTETRYPTARYIVGKGCVALTNDAAHDQHQADLAARAEIAKQIEVRVVQVIDAIQQEIMANESVAGYHSISVQSQEMVEKNLKGVKIVDRQKDINQNIQCSVAVLDKQAMAARIKGDMDAVKQEIATYLDTARQGQVNARQVDTLRCFALAMLSVDRLAVSAKMLMDLGYSPSNMPSRIEIWQKWKQALEEVKIEPVQGKKQRTRAGNPLPEPLVVKVLSQNSQPVSNVPLKVLRMPQDCEMQQGMLTGPEGMARFQVYRATPDTGNIGEIVLGIDWERLITADQLASTEKAPWQTWDTREISFFYTLPSPADYRVGVAVFESGTNRPLRSHQIQSALLAGLQNSGFKTKDVFTIVSFKERPTAEQACALLLDKLDILILGEVSLQFSSQTSDFTFYRARGNLNGMSISDVRTLTTLDLEAKGGGLDEDRAASQALRKLAKGLQEKIGPALEKALE